MDLRVAALQKWSNISPASPESTVTERVLTRLTGLGRLSSLLRPSSSPPARSLLRARRLTSDMSVRSFLWKYSGLNHRLGGVLCLQQVLW